MREEQARLEVRACMSAPPLTISPETSMHTALQIMRDRTIRRLPVVDQRGMLLGVVTERDLLHAADHYILGPIAVDELMIQQVVTTTPETPLIEAAQQMVCHKVGGLPVVDAGRRVVGLITVTDIFQSFVSFLEAHEREVG